MAPLRRDGLGGDPVGLALALASVAFDLGRRDVPVTALLRGAELPVADLDTQGGSRQPETGGGFLERHRLRLAFEAVKQFAGLRQCVVADPAAEAGEDDADTVAEPRNALNVFLRSQGFDDFFDGPGGFGVLHVQNVHPSVYGVKG